MRAGARRGPYSREVRSLALSAALCFAGGTPHAAGAQVFQLVGGGSSLYQGYGGALNVWGDRYEGNVGVGYLDGLRLSLFLKQVIGHDTLRVGNDAIPVHLTTDVFGGSYPILAQGVGLRRTSRRASLFAFAGANASATPAPFVNALERGQAIGIVQAERALSPTVRLTTHALLSSRQTVLQGVAWETPSGTRAAATAGVGGNQPYGSASFALARETLDLRASYIAMGSRFRRTGVPTPAQSEADRDNVLITLRPAPGFSLGVGRQHFRQDSTLPGVPSRAMLHQAYASARIAGLNVAGGVFDARTPGTRSVSSYLSASRDVVRWLQSDVYLLRVWSPEPVRSTVPVIRLREFVSPRWSLLQVVTRASGRTTVSFGGALVSGLTSIGLDYQVVHTPYRPTQPFVQAVALNVRLPLGNYRLSATSFLSPDGRVNYAGSASTFFYAGDVLSGGATATEIRFERYVVRGRVVDEGGASVEGAAITIGTATVFTDSQGRFFARFARRREVSVGVLVDEFLTNGRFAVVSAPAAATPTADGEAAPLRIVVRRLGPEPATPRPAPAG